MLDKFDEFAIGKSFEEINYVELAEDAAQRTRWTAIILVIATVITFIGFYNSTRWSWAFNRLDSIYNNEIISKINYKEDGVKPIVDSYFGVNDFKDLATLKSFACKIVGENASGRGFSVRLSGYLYEKGFNTRTRKLADEECKEENRENPPDELFVELVIFDLNIVLKDTQLYRQGRALRIPRQETTYLYDFGQFQNSRSPNWILDELYNRTNGQAGNTLKIHESIRLNRLLLEEAYSEIEKSRDIIPIDSDDDGNVLSSAEKRRLNSQTETTRSFVDNVRNIHIPFFGISIDVNDLGLIGGISLIIILALYRFNLSREIKNLNISFREAFRYGKLDSFYHSLAMRQVLTVPEMKGETKNTVLDYSAKLISLLPAIVLIFGVCYDWYSVLSLSLFEFREFWKLLCAEVVLALVILIISLKCLERKLHIDEIWSDYYYLLESKITYDVLKKVKFEPKARFRRIIRERFFDETIDKRFWLWKLLERFPGFLKRVYWRLFVDNRFIKWFVNFFTKYSSEKVPLVLFPTLFIVALSVYLSIWIFFNELTGVYLSVAKIFEELWKYVNFEAVNIVIGLMFIGAAGTIAAIISNFINNKKEKGKEEDKT